MAAVALLAPAAVVTGGEEKAPLEEVEVEVVVRAIVADGDGREANAAAPVVNGCEEEEEEVPAHAAEGGTVAAMVEGNAAAPSAEGDMVAAAIGEAPAAEGDTVAAMVAAKAAAHAAEVDKVAAVVGENDAAYAATAEGGTVVAVVDGKGDALQAIPVADGGNDEVAVAEGVNAITTAAAEGEEEEEEEEGVKWLKHYSSIQSILTVGDGDFSFSLALATAFGSGDNLVATSLDTIEDLRGKYSRAESNIMDLKRMGATVLYRIDAKRMKDHTSLKLRRFDRIVFNFPHAGFKGKEDDLHMINLHRELVWGFFQNARHLLRPYGEIHVSHKIGLPYDRWCIEHLAYESSLTMIAKVVFRKEDYPGYNQKRGDSAKCDQPFELGACCTFMFIRDLTRLKRVHRNRIDSFSSLEVQAQHGIPFHPRPLVPAYPQPHFPSQVNAVHSQVPPELSPLGIAHRQQPGFPDSFGGIERDPYQHGAIRPVFGMPGRLLNVVPPLDGTPPPMRGITRISFPAPQERYIMDPEVRDDYYRFAREYPRNLQEEYEMERQVMPRGTRLRYVDFLENRYEESVRRQDQLRRLIAQYGGYD
uniref:25S rRNA (uridine-N(3))-methyltransferase BMT5-like domain-containing protein n=1 Tax=Oryza punctata TaxID=4537 RepID=A0A0E0M2I9_ORYPU